MSLGGDWTVAVALTHLAFWDYWQAAAIRGFVAGRPFPASDDPDAPANAAIEAIGLLVDPESAGASAVGAASQLDALIEELSPAQRTELIDSGHAYAVRRSGHRDEHMVQIEAALG